MKKLIFFLTLFLSITTLVSAQKLKIEEGSLAPLKGETKMNIRFIYDGMGVGKYENEEDYVEKRRRELNAKEAGRGDKWADAWVADRKLKFHVKFIELFHEYDKNITLVENDETATYTMIFHTIFTEPGFNVAIARQNAYINAIIYIVETKDPEKIVSRIALKKAPGRDVWGFDFDTGTRISEAYAVSGKTFAKLLAKEAK